ncbi:MAG: 3-deoxy-D-manno-octulosonate 8-phosphate phosphatase, YrbI family [Ignavibacteria bacterium]|nr:3-deoxy-D-manno-octulosonate 8-phosphate phosphatase, YrbI family [Ignavibacteria bacterium]
MTFESLTEKLRKIKLLAMDVDGTLTDGAMYYTERGEELKRFSTRDGMGIKLLQNSGIFTAIITSENSLIAQARARKLEIEDCIINSKDKVADIRELAQTRGLTTNEIAYIGDDINDLEIIKIVGVSACPSDAVDAVRQSAGYVCKASGGNGAVREFAEMIVTAQNKSISYVDAGRI